MFELCRVIVALYNHSLQGGSNPPLLRHPPLDPSYPQFLKFLFPLPSFLFHPLLMHLNTVPPTLMQPPPALIQPTNLPWFKKISKG